MDSRIRKISKGNRKAQSAFYDEYSALVMGTCLRYLKDRELAADVFQEAFIKIFQNIHQVKDPKALGGWVKRVTVNAALDHLKATNYPDKASASDGHHELSDQFYGELLDRMSVETVLQLIDELPEGYRIIFSLSVIDGYTHKEIAEKLKISESTSRSQLTHARKLLKRLLNQIGITKYEQVI